MKGELLILVLTTLLFSSCNQKSFDSKEELLIYIKNPENGYFQEKLINGITITHILKPTDLLVLQDLSQGSLQNEKIQNLRENYKKFLYFELSFSKNGKDLLSTIPRDTDEFGGFVSHLSFNMNENIHLINSLNDTINTVDIIYPRMFGLNKKTTLFLVFENDPSLFNSDSITLLIEDFGINTGEVRFNTPTKLIKNQPFIDFK